MKLSFLIQLMLMLIFIVCVYLLFTNSIQGRTKLFVILFSLIVGVYLFYKLPFMRDYNEFLSHPVTARKSYKMPINKEHSGEFGISTWIYIDDWNYKNGEKKYVLTTNNNTIDVSEDNDFDDIQDPTDMLEEIDEGIDEEIDEDNSKFFNMYLDEYKNDLIINLNIANIDETPLPPQKIKIENVSIQKWINIILTITNRSVDVYINGKLVKTHTFENLINVPNFSNRYLKITKNGTNSSQAGFGGYVSKIRFYPYFITPRKAWNIYYNGFGDIFESSLNKYNMSISFYEDNKETNKYILF
tara:strand:+ start:1864 stop:2763 length:900 start_codon:yes stop_codon:yes gene_type:complete